MIVDCFAYVIFNTDVNLFHLKPEITSFSKFGTKDQNCQFKLKFGSWINSNVQKSMAVFTFCFQPPRKYQLKIKFATMINLNMKNLKLIFIFDVFDRKYLFFGKFCAKLYVQEFSVQNCMVVFTFSLLGHKYPFWENWSESSKLTVSARIWYLD